MPLAIKHGGVWRKEPKVSVRHGGVWKRAKVFIKDNGLWKLALAVVSHALSYAGSRSTVSSQRWFEFTSISSIVTGGAVTSRTWGFSNPQYGSWIILSGQGTGTVAIRANGSNQNQATTATLYCDVVSEGETYRAALSFSHTWQGFN